MIVLVVIISFVGATVQGCFHGDARLVTADNDKVVQICYNGNWRGVCRNNGWRCTEASVMCNQLGYSNTGAEAGWKCQNPNTVNGYLREVNCEGSESNLTECTAIPHATCDQGRGCEGNLRRHATVECQPVNCENNTIRLINGSTIREGKVEVCMDGRWGTACNNNHEGLAGAVCAQLGFPAEEAEQTVHKAASIYQCKLNTENKISCEPAINGFCTESLGVVCQTHKTIVKKIISKCQDNCEVRIDEKDRACNQSVSEVLSTCNRVTEASSNGVSNGATEALGGVVGVLVVLLIILAVGWTLTCVTIWNRNLIKRKPTKTDPTEPSTCTTNRQFANPVYDSTTDNNYSSSGPTYELVDANDGPTATYSVIERDHMTPEPTSEDEDHTYHVLEVGPVEEGACDYEVPLSRHSQVPLCEQEYSTLQH